MSAVIRQWCLLLTVASSLLVGCSSERDRQWYKPNVNYTVDQFKQDRDQCTDKDHQVDEDCLKQRGWIPLTNDKVPTPALQPGKQKSQRGPSY